MGLQYLVLDKCRRRMPACRSMRAWKSTRALLIAAAAVGVLGIDASRAADVAKGEAAFVRQCAICHTIDKGGENRLGPNLFGIVGRRAGTMQGFRYTNA